MEICKCSRKTVVISAICMTISISIICTIGIFSFPFEKSQERSNASITDLNASVLLTSPTELSPAADITPPIDWEKCKPLQTKHHSPSLKNVSLTDLLTTGVQKMDHEYQQHSEARTAAIFIFGNPASEKTTTAQILAGNLHNLYATRSPTGSFVVVDNHTIGKNANDYNLLIPHYLVNSTQNVAIWDCPTFDDTREPKADVAAMYFLRHALELTKSAKFLFTVSHSSVSSLNDQLDFDKLVGHASNMIKNINRMTNSTGLIITQVPGHEPVTGTQISDEVILSQINEFLNVYVETKENELKRSLDYKQRKELRSKVNFMRMILGENEIDQGTPRLYFIRRPTYCGALGDMDSMLETRTELISWHATTLKYYRVDLENFHFSLKPETLIHVENVLLLDVEHQIYDRIIQTFTNIKTSFSQIFHKKLQERRQVGILFLNAVFDSSSEIHRSPVRSQKLSYQINALINILPFQVGCANVSHLQILESQLEFLSMSTNNSFWMYILQEIAFNSMWAHLHDLKELYEFSSYVRQHLSSLCNQKILSSLVSSNKHIFETEKVLEFLQINGLIEIHPRIQMLWSETRLEDKKYFAMLVRKYIPKAEFSCKKSSTSANKHQLLVSGRNLLLSHATNSTNWPSECTEDNVNEVLIIGMETVYFDNNFSASRRQIYLSIIAPEWIIDKNFTGCHINLNGIGSSNGKDKENERSRLSARNTGSFYGLYGKSELPVNEVWVEIIATEIKGAEQNNGDEGIAGIQEIVLLQIDYAMLGNISQLLLHRRKEGAETPDITQTGHSQFKFWRIVNEYKIKSLGYESDEIESFLGSLNADPLINNLMEPLAFAKELEALEQQNFSINRPNIFQSHYDNLLKRINAFIELTDLKNRTNQDTAFLNLIYTAVLAKQAGLRKTNSMLKVIKTSEYFVSLSSQLQSLKGTQREKVVQKETENFKKILNKKMEEANLFIINTVNPAIQNAKIALEKTNSKLEDELQEFMRAAKNDVEQAERAKAKYRAYMPLRIGLDVLKFVGIVCSFLGPKGAVVGGIIYTSASTIKKFVPGESRDSKAPSLALPESFKKSLENLNNKDYEKKIQAIDKQTDLWEKAAAEIDKDTLQDLKEKVEKRNRTVEEFKKAVANGLQKQNPIHVVKLEREMELANDEFKEAVAKKADAIKNYESAKDEAKMVKAEAEKMKRRNEKILKNLDKTFKILDSAKDLGMNILEEVKGLDRLDAVIKKANKNVKIVEAKKIQFYDEFLPQLSTIENDITLATSILTGESQVALSVKRWNVKGMIKKMRTRVREFASGMKTSEEFQLAFDSVDEAFTLMMDLYEHIERYEEKKQLADFIAKVTIANADLSEITDDELRVMMSRLNFDIHSNLFLEEYKYALHAFKQWVFPFPYHYLNGRNIGNRSVISTNVDQLLGFYMKEVEFLRSELEKYKATTVTGDKYLMRLIFTSDAVSSEPFYVWENGKWQVSICKLLRGESVHLMADVDMRGHPGAEFFTKKSAIKYKTIELSLKVNDESRQKELNEKLNHFYMNMTHSGISLYKAMGQHFVMYDSSQSYHYSIERIGNNDRVSTGMLKYKVDGLDVDFLMSPYTWWTFQLFDVKSGGVGFSDLQEFCEEVELHLEGVGVFLDEKNTPESVLNDLNLDQHYEVYDPEDSKLQKGSVDECSI